MMKVAQWGVTAAKWKMNGWTLWISKLSGIKLVRIYITTHVPILIGAAGDALILIIHLGRFELPITQLTPPSASRLLRKIDCTFVCALKGNIRHDPLGTGVPAAVVFTNQVTKAVFQE